MTEHDPPSTQALAVRAAPQTPAALPRLEAPEPSRLQRTFTGPTASHVEVSRVVPAPVPQVMAALGRVAPRAPYFLELKTLDGSMAQGGVAGFRMPTAAAALVASPLAITGARSLDVEVAPDAAGSRVTLRVPLAELARRVSRESAAVAAVGATLAGGAAVVVAKGLIAVALLGLPFTLTAGLALPVGAALSRRGWRKREAQLQTLLGELADAIALDVRVGGAFAGPAPPPTSSDGDVSAAFIALGS